MVRLLCRLVPMVYSRYGAPIGAYDLAMALHRLGKDLEWIHYCPLILKCFWLDSPLIGWGLSRQRGRVGAVGVWVRAELYSVCGPRFPAVSGAGDDGRRGQVAKYLTIILSYGLSIYEFA